MALLARTSEENGIDVAIISEPNKNGIRSGPWWKSARADVAITTYGNTRKLVNEFGLGDAYVWIRIGRLVIYGCYISPNIHITDFERELRGLSDSMARNKHNGKVILVGDFNAKAQEWGAPHTDRRGQIMMEWLAQNKLEIVNVGDKPTFSKRNQSSHIDITACSEKLVGTIKNWKVTDDENLSDHRNIEFEVEWQVTAREKPTNTKGWLIKTSTLELFAENLKTEINEKRTVGLTYTEGEFHAIMEAACNATFKKKGTRTGKTGNYWWNEETADKRKACIKARRKMQRINANSRIPLEEKERQQREYTNTRKELRIAIAKAKEAAWGNLCETVENDVWGNGYKLVMNKLNLRPQINMDKEQKKREIEKLFPTDTEQDWDQIITQQDDQDENTFTEEQVKAVSSRLKNNKATGPDLLPAEIIKVALNCCTEYCTEMFNKTWRERKVPKAWKVARLVFLEKPKKDEQGKTTYRPICILNSIAKTFEHLILDRLQEVLQRKGKKLNDRQFGFQKRKSTIDAMQIVKETAENVNRGHYKYRDLCVLVSLDIQNAFNSAPWVGIIKELIRWEMPKHMVEVIADYFTDRWLEVGENDKWKVTRGVPQGSVLGPLLWNIYYDGILEIPMPQGVTSVGFADDVAVIVRGRTEEDLRRKTNLALNRINEWIKSKDLKLAPHKTEAVVLVGRQKLKTLEIQIENTHIITVETLKYLGVTFSRNNSMAKHVEYIASKASNIAKQLGRILPNQGGASLKRRRLIATVIYSIVLYAAPIWGDILKKNKWRKKLEGVQRAIMLRVGSAYRTVSTEALQVITGTLPIDLMVQERIAVHDKADHRSKKEIREGMINTWQTRWLEIQGKAGWTKKLIRDIRIWLKRKHGNVGFHMTQCLTGHGCFGNYLAGIGKEKTVNCWYCGEEDTPQHTIFDCPKWERHRHRVEFELGELPTPDNIIENMLECKRSWDAIETFIGKIMRQKEADEKKREIEGLRYN